MRRLSIRVRNWCVCSACASVPYGYAQHAHQFLTLMLSMLWRDLFKFGIFMLMLSIRVRNWSVCSGYASVPDPYAQRTHQFLTRMLKVRISSWCICSAFFEGNALFASISTWRVCSVHAPVPYSYAQRTHQFLTCMLSARISSWRLRACWGYTKWTFEK
jgi:hypothetical protein